MTRLIAKIAVPTFISTALVIFAVSAVVVVCSFNSSLLVEAEASTKRKKNVTPKEQPSIPVDRSSMKTKRAVIVSQDLEVPEHRRLSKAEVNKLLKDLEVTSSRDIIIQPITHVIQSSTDQQQIPSSEVRGKPAKAKGIISHLGPSKYYVYRVTPQEELLIASVVYVEARGECYQGKVAVAAVILNRWRAGYAKTISGVINKKGAFASISKVTHKQALTCLPAVRDALRGYDPTRKVFKDGAKYFFAPKSICKTEAAKRTNILKLRIGNHDFHNEFQKVVVAQNKGKTKSDTSNSSSLTRKKSRKKA